MRRILLLAFVLSIYTQNNRIIIDSTEQLIVPGEIKGEFKVAANPPVVEAILLSGLPQDNKSTLWSSWGNGALTADGRYYMAVGDHRGYDGNSYVYEYDPAARTLKKIVDIAESIGQRKGDYGHGKIHSQIHEYRGSLYFATYWGKSKEVADAVKKGYRGSLLFRYDLKSRNVENLGPIAPGEGLPTSCLDSGRGLLYFYSVEKGDVLVYELNKRTVKFKGGGSSTAQHRCYLQSKDGKIWFADEKGKLSFYDPDKNSIFESPVLLPGQDNSLRASARATSDGRIFGMTRAGKLFEFNPTKQAIKDLGSNFLSGDYTAVMVLSPDEKYLYFAPGAHGSATRMGTPVVQYQISNGTRKVITFLRDSMIKKAAYFIGGTYSMQIDSKGAILYCVFNGAKHTAAKNLKAFGLPSFVAIKIPEAERK